MFFFFVFFVDWRLRYARIKAGGSAQFKIVDGQLSSFSLQINTKRPQPSSNGHSLFFFRANLPHDLVPGDGNVEYEDVNISHEERYNHYGHATLEKRTKCHVMASSLC